MNLKEEWNRQANILVEEVGKRLHKNKTMNNLAIFKYQEKEVRTLEENNVVWFAGRDVALVLGYSDTDQAIRNNVDEEDKITRESDGGRNLIFINESGLYSLILRSKLDSAKDFKRWVTKEVLPSIRTTGAYISPNATTDQLVKLTNTLETVLANQQVQLEELKEQTKLIPAFFDAGTKHKGCSNIVMSAMEYEEDVEEVYLTVLQWLQAKGVTLSTTQLNTMRKRAAQFLRLGRQKEPNKINNRVVYHSSEFCYLEQALSNVLGLD